MDLIDPEKDDVLMGEEPGAVRGDNPLFSGGAHVSDYDNPLDDETPSATPDIVLASPESVHGVIDEPPTPVEKRAPSPSSLAVHDMSLSDPPEASSASGEQGTAEHAAEGEEGKEEGKAQATSSSSSSGGSKEKKAAAVAAAAAAAKEEVDEEDELPDWPKYDKHVFVLSIAGKPIYSRHGNEDKLSTIMGVMLALTSFVQEDKDQLRSIVAGDRRFTFLNKNPIVLVNVGNVAVSENLMATQLTYVYNQILFVLTHSQLTRIFQQRVNYDLRRMLSDSDRFLDHLVDSFDTDPSYFLRAIRCLPLNSGARDKIGQVLQTHRIKDLVFALLIADNQVITLLRPKKYSLLPQDIHLIVNLVAVSSSFRSSESWIPLCLPKFNAQGFLHAHVSYIDDASNACLFLISNNKEVFPELSACRSKIIQSLSSNGCLQAISQALNQQSYTVAQLEIPDLRHFIYKTKSSSQFTSPALEAPYTLPGEAKRLMMQYQLVHHRIHSQARPLKIYFYAAQNETMLGWVTSGFEVFAAFGPLVSKPSAINAVLRLIRWMKQEEAKLFIVNSQTF